MTPVETTVAMPPGVVLRLPQDTDAKALRPLVDEALGGLRHHSEQKLRGVVRSIAHARDDWVKITVRQQATDTEKPLQVMISARVAACERTGRLLGVCYSAPPLEWMRTATRIRSGTAMSVLENYQGLARRLSEVNVLGVQRAHRGKGIARALLADSAARHRAGGYGALSAITNGKHLEGLRGFYAACGYYLGNPDERWWVEFGPGTHAIYHDLNAGQSMHVLPLDDQTWINPGPPRPAGETGPRLMPSLMGLLIADRPGGRCPGCTGPDGVLSACRTCGGGRRCTECGRIVHPDGRACAC